MRIGWRFFLVSLVSLSVACAADWRRKYEMQLAPGFLFDRQHIAFVCEDRPSKRPIPPGSGFVTFSPQAPFMRTRQQDLVFSRSEVPALTLAVDLGAAIVIDGEDRNDWSLGLCAQGEGNSEAEARGRMQEVSMRRVGGAFTLGGRDSDAWTAGRARLAVHAPQDAPAMVHASFAGVEVYDMAGPVLVTANHARVTILDTTGRVDATGDMVDFAGEKGRVMLNGAKEVDVKFTASRFEGTLSAMAQRPVRVLMPKGFQTPFRALVGRKEDFVCRMELCSRVRPEKQNGLYVFTYAGDGGAREPAVSFRSEEATVVIDAAD
jgi:hypothetical protein